MRVFVTGGAGWLGAETVRALLAAKHDVALLLRAPSQARRVRDCLSLCNVIQGDLDDSAPWRKSLISFRPDAVLHLAWSGVHNDMRNDMGQVSNVARTLNLVTSAAEAGARHWIGVGSQAEYGQCQARIAESQITRPTTLYGVCKLCAGLAAARACEENGMRFAWLRLFSSYGPGDDARWMIPYVILSLMKGERPMLTWGEQRWDYLFVRDAAQALVDVLETSIATGVFNLGSGVALPLRKAIEAIRDEVDPRLPLGFGEVPYRPDQVMHLEADISRLKQITGWQPNVSFQEGIHETIKWYQLHQHEYN